MQIPIIECWLSKTEPGVWGLGLTGLIRDEGLRV